MASEQSNNPADMHAEHRQWQENLLFYQDELRTFQDRLREVTSKNPGAEVQAWVEHFQNQFTIQQELIDELNHHFREHERAIKDSLQSSDASDSEARLNDHAEEKGKMKVFERFQQELKKDLNKFLAKNLLGQAGS
jgi:hypothetical protein